MVYDIEIVNNTEYYLHKESGNKLRTKDFVDSEAAKILEFLIVNHCINCENCINCVDCVDCKNCKDCWKCSGCINCDDCTKCKTQKNLKERDNIKN